MKPAGVRRPDHSLTLRSPADVFGPSKSTTVYLWIDYLDEPDPHTGDDVRLYVSDVRRPGDDDRWDEFTTYDHDSAIQTAASIAYGDL